MQKTRHDWTLEELSEIYHRPLLKLVSDAHGVHTLYHNQEEIQLCHLISIKTGGCPEDCKYCSQSSRYQTSVSAQPMMKFEEVMAEAKKEIAQGVSRICLVAAWREVRDSQQFEQVLAMVREITALGAEVCCCLGMLKEHQAKKLKEAGLYAYNHNLDSSEEFYQTIITTRTYQDRLNTLDVIEKAHISVCCGGIIGMGETVEDRLKLLLTLCTRPSHPDSIPINRLYPVPGTPLENAPALSNWEHLRLIATARIVLPTSMLRLSAGRVDMSDEQQALCFLAGVNSIHVCEKQYLLTVALPNAPLNRDLDMLSTLGLKPMRASLCLTQ